MTAEPETELAEQITALHDTVAGRWPTPGHRRLPRC
jgi:hypothetical protein